MSDEIGEKHKPVKRPHGLGRGLSALLGDVSREEPVAAAASSATPSSKSVQNIEVALIQPHPEQPRRHFDQDALEAVADTALARNIGARGLRAVMEGLLTKVMYDVPSDPTISDVTITKACVDGNAEPTVLHDPEKVAQRAKFKTGTAEKTSTAPAS